MRAYASHSKLKMMKKYLLGLVSLFCAMQLWAAVTPEQIEAELLEACNDNKVAACVLLGNDYLAADNAAKAATFFDQACQGGSGTGCSALGVLYQFGEGLDKDVDQAKNLFAQACERKEETGCSFLGLMLLNGEGVAKDPSTAVTYLSQACQILPDSDACLPLGNWQYDHGTNAQDQATALSILEKSCAAGRADSCESRASKLWQQGEDERLSSSNTSAQCGTSDCKTNLSTQKSLVLNPKQQAALFSWDQACQLDSRAACQQLVQYYSQAESNLGNRKKVTFYQNKLKALVP